VLYAHLNEPPPRPSASREKLPPALDEVVAAALAKAPAERPAVLLSGDADDMPGRPPLRIGSDVLAAVDPRSGRVVSRVQLPGRPDELARAGRSTWVLVDGRRSVTRVDARTSKVSPPVRLPFAAGGIAPGTGGLWVAEASGPRIALVGGRGVERTHRHDADPNSRRAGPPRRQLKPPTQRGISRGPRSRGPGVSKNMTMQRR